MLSCYQHIQHANIVIGMVGVLPDDDEDDDDEDDDDMKEGVMVEDKS